MKIFSTNSVKQSNITALCKGLNGKIAVGYQNGQVSIFNMDGTEEMNTTGHTTAVQCLNFNQDGSLLASGGDDTEICVWDVVNSSGLYRLRGHKGSVTSLSFLNKINCLISCSKDTLIKIWELDTQHCIQTLVGTRHEIWSLTINNDESRLVIGSIDNEIRFWDLTPLYIEGKEIFERDPIFLGSIQRKFENRVFNMQFSSNGEILGLHGDNNVLEVLVKRSEKEIAKKQKEILQKKVKKENVKKEELEQEEEPKEEEEKEKYLEFKYLTEVRTLNKIRSFDFHPTIQDKKEFKVIIGTLRNSIEEYLVTPKDSEKTLVIDREGHGTPVRALSISSDDQTFLSVSNNQCKIWNLESGVCVKNLDTEGNGLCCTFLPGNFHFAIGTKNGDIELFELASMSFIDRYKAHEGPVNSILLSPDKSGLITCGDKSVKFWKFEVVDKKLTITNEHILKMSDSVVYIQCSFDARFIAISLLDSTVKVFFLDSLKFFLSLYGHKLPVNSIDISSDGNLIITGSSDKNIKIWGLDFGDCHKSIFGHQESITSLQFIKNTHYFTSISKDGCLKLWDADTFECIQEIRAPIPSSPLYCLSNSYDGNTIITSGHERGIIIFRKTEELYFLEEEQERKMEENYEKDLIESQQYSNQLKLTEFVGKRTIETITTGERLIENIQIAMDDEERWIEYEKQKDVLEKPQKNIKLEGMKNDEYVWYSLNRIPKSEVSLVLSIIPFKHAIFILKKLNELNPIENIEFASNIVITICEIFQSQLMNDSFYYTLLLNLSQKIKSSLVKERNLLGFNLAALSFVKRRLTNEKELLNIDEAITLNKHIEKKKVKEEKWKKNQKRKIQEEVEEKEKKFKSMVDEENQE